VLAFAIAIETESCVKIEMEDTDGKPGFYVLQKTLTAK
jgi:hypothetical protein